jgi:quercetin dioxygenase-like cupin family protein
MSTPPRSDGRHIAHRAPHVPTVCICPWRASITRCSKTSRSARPTLRESGSLCASGSAEGARESDDVRDDQDWGLELRFLQSKEEIAGSLDAFEMTVQPNARMPVAHYHESWDETIYGLTGASTWRVDGRDVVLEPGQTIFIKRGIVHAFRNDTQEAASAQCILTPGVLGPG